MQPRGNPKWEVIKTVSHSTSFAIFCSDLPSYLPHYKTVIPEAGRGFSLVIDEVLLQIRASAAEEPVSARHSLEEGRRERVGAG